MRRSPTAPLFLVLTLWAAGLGAAAQFGKISIVFDLMATRYGGSPVATGMIVSVVGIVGLVFGTTAGLWVTALGFRRVLVGALLLGAAVSAVEAADLPYGILIALRMVEGVSHLAIVVAAPTVISLVAPPASLGLAMTLWSSFFGVSFALLAWIGRPLAEAAGVPGLFLAHAAYLAALALALWRMMPEDPPPTAPSISPRRLLADHVAIYRSPFEAAPALGFVCYTALYVALLTLLPPLFPDAQRVIVATGMPLISIAVSLTLGLWLLRHLPAVAIVGLGFGAGGLSALALALSWGQGGAVAAALGLSGALGLVQGASFASIPQLNLSAQGRARAAGAIAQLGNVGTTAGTPLLAAILAGTGWPGIIGFTLPLCAAGIGVHLWQAARRRRA